MVERVLCMHEAQDRYPASPVFLRAQFVIFPRIPTKRQNGKRAAKALIPCGQSPADFKSASLTTRTSCLANSISVRAKYEQMNRALRGHLKNKNKRGQEKIDLSTSCTRSGNHTPRPLTRCSSVSTTTTFKLPLCGSTEL